MPERLVDVLNDKQTVLHTYPITVGEADCVGSDAAFVEKATEAAAFDQLVPDDHLDTLSARMHVSRGGTLAPYGDDERGSLAETKHGLNEVVRELAYCLWEQDGSPEGRADEYWHRAREQRLRERAYIRWQQDGSPEGRADEYWHRTVQHEA
jgi:hypothetical protein